MNTRLRSVPDALCALCGHRFGSCVWDERRASVLQAMLTSAVQRRFPPGLRVHVFTGSAVCLQDLVRAMKRHRLTITR